jgi:hypothetical protein
MSSTKASLWLCSSATPKNLWIVFWLWVQLTHSQPARQVNAAARCQKGSPFAICCGHTSGIYNFTEDPDFWLSTFDEPACFWTPEDVVAVVVDRPVARAAQSQSGQ